MEQQGLTQKDMVPYIGSQSKVSEVLNRRRPLSLSMIRALHEGLGIPAEVLLQEPGKELDSIKYDPKKFPIKEMFNRSYFSGFQGSLSEAKAWAEELLEQLMQPVEQMKFQRVYCRQSPAIVQDASALAVAETSAVYPAAVSSAANQTNKVDENALAAWHARALQLAEEQDLPPYYQSRITKEFIQDIIRLSYYDNGPLMARDMLNSCGIAFVLLPHLPRTYLDGASFKTAAGRAVVGITLRFDRLDNFWFTLVHELAHIYLHFNDNYAFFDDTEKNMETSMLPVEQQANKMAWEQLISTEKWEKFLEAYLLIGNEDFIQSFADELRISPAIVAGRIRWEMRNYSIYSNLIGSKKVKKQFFPPQEIE